VTFVLVNDNRSSSSKSIQTCVINHYGHIIRYGLSKVANIALWYSAFHTWWKSGNPSITCQVIQTNVILYT
ncbi:MAG: hypothetical protein ACJ71H_21030, partial [Nitrososphaeraceae archaeon]